MKMKKLIALLIAIMLIFSISSMAFAVTPVSESAEFDISDLDNAELLRVNDDGSVDLRVVRTQALSRSGNQAVSETIAKIVPLTDEAKEDLAAATRAANSNYREISDRSYQITLYSTTYFETKSTSYGTYKRLTGFSGGIRAGGSGPNVGSLVKIISSKIEYGAVGKKEEGGTASGATTINLSTAARTYSYQRTTPWILDASESSVGHNFTVVLQRGTTGTPWSTTLINQR